ncbi:MAG: ATP phosphoribosyltransferase regulatory subunit [Variibacter sp.]|nr:ATP phosphoribosyltransferase regulatory subunit [Variibacter sp.]
MRTEPFPASSRAADERASALLAHFEAAGYSRASPAILQPSEPFLDLSGEEIRRRMYLTTDAAGRELCLRPDLTIPVARDYLASPAAGAPASFCYLGPVFRYRGEASPEFLQAGIESFGRRDIAAADAEMLALAIEATAHYGLPEPEVRMGDVGLFAALIAAIDLPSAWKRRLIKDFNRAESLEHDLDQLVIEAAAHPEYQGVLAALAGADRKGAHALVTDLLSIAGITTVGGRSVAEIAERFLDQAALGASPRLPHETRSLIRRFLAISGEPDEAAAALRALASDAGIDLEAALDLFESRTGFLAARGIDVSRIRFSTGYGRGLDYYTGFVFDLHDPAGRCDRELVAGGRYDDMLTRLGSPTPIPAVGFAVWIERLATLGDAP